MRLRRERPDADVADMKRLSTVWRMTRPGAEDGDSAGPDVHTVHVNAVEAALRKAAEDLTGLGQRWAIVGGFAVSARAEPRFTRDVDIAVAVANDNAAESLVGRLLTRQNRLLASAEQDAVGRLATVRLGTPQIPPRTSWSTSSLPAAASSRKLPKLPRRSRSCLGSSRRSQRRHI